MLIEHLNQSYNNPCITTLSEIHYYNNIMWIVQISVTKAVAIIHLFSHPLQTLYNLHKQHLNKVWNKEIIATVLYFKVRTMTTFQHKCAYDVQTQSEHIRFDNNVKVKVWTILFEMQIKPTVMELIYHCLFVCMQGLKGQS